MEVLGIQFVAVFLILDAMSIHSLQSSDLPASSCARPNFLTAAFLNSLESDSLQPQVLLLILISHRQPAKEKSSSNHSPPHRKKLCQNHGDEDAMNAQRALLQESISQGKAWIGDGVPNMHIMVVCLRPQQKLTHKVLKDHGPSFDVEQCAASLDGRCSTSRLLKMHHGSAAGGCFHERLRETASIMAPSHAMGRGS